MTDQSAREPSALDVASSKACTQSGAFALLLSLALASLIPYWLEGREDAALGRYVSLRLELATQVELLDDSGTWQRFKATHEDAEDIPLAQLIQATVEGPPEGSTKDLGTKPDTPSKTQNAQAPGAQTGAPAAPIGLTVTTRYGLDEIQRAAGFLTQLDDPEMLRMSRGYSTFVNFSVYRWASRRGTLIYRHEVATTDSGSPNACVKAMLKGPMQQPHPEIVNFVPSVGEDALLSCLTLHDLRGLAEFELPKVPDTTKYGGRGGKEVDVAPGVLPRNLYMASLFAGGLLLFVVVHFRAFVGEAVSSPTFPAQGTLFGAFAGSRWILATFALSLWAPVAASLGVALVSRRPVLMLCSVLMVGAVLSVHLALRRKSYFAALNLARLLRGRAAA